MRYSLPILVLLVLSSAVSPAASERRDTAHGVYGGLVFGSVHQAATRRFGVGGVFGLRERLGTLTLTTSGYYLNGRFRHLGAGIQIDLLRGQPVVHQNAPRLYIELGLGATKETARRELPAETVIEHRSPVEPEYRRRRTWQAGIGMDIGWNMSFTMIGAEASLRETTVLFQSGSSFFW